VTPVVGAFPVTGCVSRVLVLAVLAVALIDCAFSAGGPEYLEVSVSATEDGTVQTVQRCTPVPVMPGAHAAREHAFGDAFRARIDASRDLVTITFVGINDPELANKAFSRDSLESGFAISDLRVETTAGRRFTVAITSACPVSTSGP